MYFGSDWERGIKYLEFRGLVLDPFNFSLTEFISLKLQFKTLNTLRTFILVNDNHSY